jgi:hypothetical protein
VDGLRLVNPRSRRRRDCSRVVMIVMMDIMSRGGMILLEAIPWNLALRMMMSVNAAILMLIIVVVTMAMVTVAAIHRVIVVVGLSSLGSVSRVARRVPSRIGWATTKGDRRVAVTSITSLIIAKVILVARAVAQTRVGTPATKSIPVCRRRRVVTIVTVVIVIDIVIVVVVVVNMAAVAIRFGRRRRTKAALTTKEARR